MKRKSLGLIALTVGLLLGSGCNNDSKNIEKMNYATAIGVDFKDGKYHGYVQFTDLSSVAKTSEGQKTPARIWVGEGSGSTFEDTFFNIYRTSQERIYWGHFTALIISEAAFKQGFRSIYDSITRYYEFRLTPWVYGTRDSVKEILSQTGFYGRSSLSTILHEPKGTYSQTSLIKKIKVQELVRQLNEPGFTSVIPSLSVNKIQWTGINNKPESKLMIDGAIFLKNDAFRCYIPLKELSGLRWIQHGTIRAAIPVPNPSKPSVYIIVDRPKTKLKAINRREVPQFNIEMKANGYITNRSKNNYVGFQQLTEATEQSIEQEIRKLFQLGINKKTDVLNLEHQLYRYHYRLWKEISPAEDMLLTKDVLNDIHIKLNITHSGGEKNTTIEYSK